MSLNLVLSNLLNPPVLFFFLGMAAVLIGSDLEIPPPLPKLFSLYLLLSIGFKGGSELHKSGLTLTVALSLLAALAMSIVVPLCVFALLRRRMDAANAAAIAATYGSVSAVTFIAATSFLDQLRLPYGGYMVAAMALMESPAILVGVSLARWNGASGEPTQRGELLRDAFLNGSVFVLIGSLLIGLVSGDSGEAALKPFVNDIFRGMLCFFLLDMGLVSARRLGALRQLGAFPIVFATLIPLVNATIGIGLARLIGLGVGDALLMCVLCASASYIAVPATMRMVLPEANPGLYVTMALALTFPFNIAIGLPLYLAVISALWM
jgi:hypothetical protein